MKHLLVSLCLLAVPSFAFSTEYAPNTYYNQSAEWQVQQFQNILSIECYKNQIQDAETSEPTLQPLAAYEAPIIEALLIKHPLEKIILELSEFGYDSYDRAGFINDLAKAKIAKKDLIERLKKQEDILNDDTSPRIFQENKWVQTLTTALAFADIERKELSDAFETTLDALDGRIGIARSSCLYAASTNVSRFYSNPVKAQNVIDTDAYWRESAAEWAKILIISKRLHAHYYANGEGVTYQAILHHLSLKKWVTTMTDIFLEETKIDQVVALFEE